MAEPKSGTADENAPDALTPDAPVVEKKARKKAKKKVTFRGQEYSVTKTTRDRAGAIWDYFEYDRPIPRERDAEGNQKFATIGRRIRRPGTGQRVQREEVIEE